MGNSQHPFWSSDEKKGCVASPILPTLNIDIILTKDIILHMASRQMREHVLLLFSYP